MLSTLLKTPCSLARERVGTANGTAIPWPVRLNIRWTIVPNSLSGELGAWPMLSITVKINGNSYHE